MACRRGRLTWRRRIGVHIIDMTSYERISVTPLTPAVGAELGGVDIAAGVDDETLRGYTRR